VTPALRIGVINPRTGQPDIIELQIAVAASLYRTFQNEGLEAVADLVYLVIALREGKVSKEEQDRLLVPIRDILEALTTSFQNNEDMLLSASYSLLHDKRITREEAALMASRGLGKKTTTDAWRKRVDRWAEKEGLPKVELYTRRHDESDK
jgi:hypothetical protein